MSQRVRRILPFLVLILAGYFAYEIQNSQPNVSHLKAKSPAILRVETNILQKTDFVVDVASFGTIQASTQSILFPLVSGQISQVRSRFKSGAVFKKGDILLTIDRADFEIAVQVANGDVINAELALAEEQARYAQAQRDWKKQKTQDLATDFALRLPQKKAAEANLATAKAQYKLAQLNLQRTIVHAPYDGRIQKTFVDLGSVVGPNVQLAEIYSIDAIEVRLPITNKDRPFLELPEPELGLVQTFPTVNINNILADPAEIWLGKIVRTEAAVDESSQQLYVVARINKPFHESNFKVSPSVEQTYTGTKLPTLPLKIGQYVSALIRGKTLEKVIIIPNSALYQGSYVYLVSNSKLRRQAVQILWKNQTFSVLKSGLEENDHLVTTLLGQVTSGTVVNEHIEGATESSNGIDTSTTRDPAIESTP